MKKIIARIVLIIFFLVFCFLLVNIFLVSREKEQIQSRLSKLGELPLVDLDSTLFKMPEGKALFLIYFNSMCHACESEIQSIQENISKFSDYHIVLVSEESLSVIKGFANHIAPQNSTLFFTKIRPEDTFDTFASLSIPHAFVYSKEGLLIQEFKGAHTGLAMLKALKLR